MFLQAMMNFRSGCYLYFKCHFRLLAGAPKRTRRRLRAGVRCDFENSVDESGECQWKIGIRCGPRRIHQASCGIGERAARTEEIHAKLCRQSCRVSQPQIVCRRQLTYEFGRAILHRFTAAVIKSRPLRKIGAEQVRRVRSRI